MANKTHHPLPYYTTPKQRRFATAFALLLLAGFVVLVIAAAGTV